MLQKDSIYSFKTAALSQPFDTTWNEAQAWCNFVLFKPTWLPQGLTETSNTLRPESPHEPSSHRAQFQDSHTQHGLSIKQFLYDWAPPAYDHPCLWRNPAISTPENTPLPKPYLIGNNYLWLGLDYRRKSAATINMLQTQIEITIIQGSFEIQELIQIVNGLVPVDNNAKNAILKTSFAELMFNYRHPSREIPVPTSYFDHKRTNTLNCYPYPATTKSLDLSSLFAGNLFINHPIENYKLDSVILFGKDKQHIEEVEYYFESLIEPGCYIRFLVTKQDTKHTEHAIQFPPTLCEQECNYSVLKSKDEKDLYHAWSKTNDNGSHSLVFQTHDCTINCIIKPAPWTDVAWARELCAHIA